MPLENVTAWEIARREIVAEHGIVAAKHPAAAAAGLQVLQEGGNAVDAAVTAAFAVGVAEPWMSGIGGGGFMTIHLATGEDAVIDYFGRAPQAASAGMFDLLPGARPDHLGFTGVRDDANTVGHRAVAVPGTVAGLSLALERYGTISLARALQPAIELARDGFVVEWHHALVLALSRALLTRYPATAAIFLQPSGEVHAPGYDEPALLRQPELAETLKRIAAEGPAGFYRGSVARAIVEEQARHGGLMTLDDLADYRAEVLSPLAVPYRDFTVLHIPGGAGGVTVAAALNVLAGYDLAWLGHNSARALHLTIEASRRAFADRMAYVADPRQTDVPLAALVSSGYADRRRGEIADDRATAGVRPGDPTGTGAAPPAVALEGDGGCTTHLATIDRAGNAVALTQTLTSLFGSFVTAPGAGILLNNAMNLFDPRPGHANSIAPLKRPASSMAHMVALRNGSAALTVGAPGGRRIMDTCLQVFLNMAEYGMSIQEACAAPLIDSSGPETLVDDRIPASVREQLSAMGHRIAPRPATFWPRYFASPTGIQVGPDGALRGGADPFGYGVAAGY